MVHRNPVEPGNTIHADRQCKTKRIGVDDKMHKKTYKTIVNDLVEKMAAVRRRAAAERGEFDLFALFNRKAPGAKDQWDLIVAAPWLDPGNDESWAYITNLINAMRLS